MTDATIEAGRGPGDIKEVDDLPAVDSLPEITLVGHSSLLYWWPVWAISLALGVYSLMAGRTVVVNPDGVESVISSSTTGVIFVVMLLLVIGFTSVKLRGKSSVIALLGVALMVVSLAYFNLWDDVIAAIPEMSVHMNAGFYFVFGGGLFLMWILQFLIFDRMVVYRVRPGQMIEERLIGGGERSFDAHGMLFEQKDNDFFRHWLLGLGSGDLRLITNDARNATITIPNVLWAERRVGQIQRLINVKPDHLAR